MREFLKGLDLDSELKSKVKNGGYTNGKGLNKV